MVERLLEWDDEEGLILIFCFSNLMSAIMLDLRLGTAFRRIGLAIIPNFPTLFSLLSHILINS